jgi:hypothetical protein
MDFGKWYYRIVLIRMLPIMYEKVGMSELASHDDIIRDSLEYLAIGRYRLCWIILREEVVPFSDSTELLLAISRELYSLIVCQSRSISITTLSSLRMSQVGYRSYLTRGEDTGYTDENKYRLEHIPMIVTSSIFQNQKIFRLPCCYCFLESNKLSISPPEGV